MPASVQVFTPVMGRTPDMPDLLDQFMSSLEQSEMQVSESSVEDVADDRAYISVRFSLEGLPGDMLQHIVLLRGDSYMCVVIYTFGDASDASLGDIFRRSAKTIVVKAQQGGAL